ncbi:MAG: TRZ/ATZ family hydrolase [Gammaproteobacteria bacterium]|nr:TRZ/ATZ family hydrolase [Gammaproteobacteria bacterium]MBT8133760.1 TRZ/ATZ family hydrolase [Gammaproteobacteria bacterium]NNJ49248.1 TRZ/ATZ family hydrolase [Gammaproteobacteria bacterium]
MKNIDTLLHARWVIPVDGKNRFLEHHCIAIHDDRILEILPCDDAREKYSASVSRNYDQHALIPGLINSHTHAAMNLFRGLADDLGLMDWLENHIWPAESLHVNEAFVHTGTELAIAEMIRGGTTCFNDMYFFPDITARVAADIGMRASVGLILIDFPTVWANNSEEYIDKGLAVFDHYKGHELIKTAFAPHAPYTVSDQPLKRIRTLSDELELSIHMHIHETAHEVSEARKNTGVRPLTRLYELGLLTPALQAVHMTQLHDDEIPLLASSGSHVIHCPESNMKLASGTCPVKALHDAGVNVALGTDSSSSNNDLDMFGEMRSAAMLAKISTMDATAVPAEQALQMATINGARALGIDDITGSLEPGKFADIVAVNFDTIETVPVYDPVSHLVYCSSREHVSDVWIAGRQRLTDRVLNTIDESRLKADCIRISENIREN